MYWKWRLSRLRRAHTPEVVAGTDNVATVSCSFHVREHLCSRRTPRLRRELMERNTSRQQILDLHRQFPHANSCCVMDRGGDAGGDAGQADFADAAGAEFVNLLVGEVEEMHVD